tara:strand:+ start:1397 stop:2380 length:984 start_codon:yes stop_codon:yes gene_type:complete
MPTEPLSFRSVGHSYSGPAVFQEVSLSVAAGELVSILGASGSGKSTLLRAAAGFVTPTQGTVLINGAEVARDGQEKLPAEQRRVGMMFQDYALFPHLSVADNIGFGLHRATNATQRIHELLELIGLNGLGERRPGELSGGQQQRVALARALAPRPSLLLLDEPFANLDGPLRFQVGRQVVEILAREGVGGLLVTHDREEALGLSHRVAVLGATAPGPSTLLQIDAPEQVYNSPNSVTVAQLTGRVSVLQHSPQTCLLVRPEEASFVSADDGQARVTARRYCGGGWELEVETSQGSLLIDQGPENPPAVGARGEVQFQTERIAPNQPR